MKRSASEETVRAFCEAVYPRYTDLAMASNGEGEILAGATRVILGLKAQRDQLRKALEWISKQYEDCLKIMREHGWRYTDSENVDQKMAFTMYSHVVECSEKARAALAEQEEKG